MQVIGIGTGGCQVVSAMEQYNAYDIICIDTSFKAKTKNIISIELEKQETFKEYEVKTTLDIRSKILYDSVHVFLFGGGKTTGSVLRILEKIKDKKITVHYMKPEKNLLSVKQKLRERATCGILQHMARSGVFNKIYLYDTSKILEGQEVPFLKKKDYVASTIAGMFHMINFSKNTEDLFSNVEEPTEVNRIATIGTVNPQDGKEVLYFSLDSIREKCYYFVMNKSALETPGVVEKINDQIKEENEQSSFKIIESDWPDNHVYMEAFTNVVQTTQNKTEE
tara:strand:- start:801 stop:1640 length:840 start_codon:yes stop_codon:yes gene_type:complete